MNHSNQIVLRAFTDQDYNQVFQLIQESSVESWTTAYWNTLNGKKSMPWLLRLGVFVLAIQMKMPWPIIICSFYELALMGFIFLAIFWIPLWRGLLENMTDYQLQFWTKSPNKLYVAALANEPDPKKPQILGTVALKCVQASSTNAANNGNDIVIMDLCHLCVHLEHRGIGLGTHLVQHALENIPQLKERTFIQTQVVVLDCQEEAIQLFQKLGFSTVEKRSIGLTIGPIPIPIVNLCHDVRELVMERRVEKS